MDKDKWIEVNGIFYSKKANRSGNHLVCTFVDGKRTTLPPVRDLPQVDEVYK